mmetsp:Transcript_158898/g.281682  ORF Transcript_158898/g.281682 Transcript_158898/m.281682 type:complete len:288 (-) Transcript_158898:68-931(-)
MADLGLWTITAIVPRGGGECREYEIGVDPEDTCTKVKSKIEKVCGVPPDDMELFYKTEGPEGKNKWLKEGETLAEQEVVDGAVITVGVHGLKSDAPLQDPETGEVPDDAVGSSLATRGDTSYYHAHRGRAQDSRVTEEQRIVSGGAPQMLAEGEAEALSSAEKRPMSMLLFEDDSSEAGRARRAMKNYSWGDEKEFIKIYISKDGEPDAIAAAGDGKSEQVEVKFRTRALNVTVHDKLHDWVLQFDNIYYEIIPEESKWRVSKDKRITVSLRKKENFTWLKLLKPDN